MSTTLSKVLNRVNNPQKKYNLKVGIVGCGFVSQFHVAAWQSLGCNVAAYCDINPKALENAVKNYGEAPAYLDYREMFEKESLDAISVCTFPFNHAEIIAEALKHNILVGVEKPFVCNAKEAEPFRSSNKIVLVHNQMFESMYYEVFKLLQAKALGEVYHASAFLGDPVDERMTKDVAGWAYKLRGGRIAESMPHPIYEIQFALGDNLQVHSVDVEPFTDGKPTFRALTAVLTGSGGSRGVVNMRMDAAKTTDTLTVHGEDGVVDAGLVPANCVLMRYGEKPKTVTPTIRVASRVLLFESLINGQPLASASHAYHNARLIDEIVNWALALNPLEVKA